MSQEINVLEVRRRAVEEQLNELHQLLKSQGVGMDDPLVDAEGFPRADVDLYAVRNARAAIIRLQNDHKQLSEQLHAALVQMHQAPVPGHGRASISPKNEWTPFAVVHAVAPDSPAAVATLLAGDLVLQVDTVTCMSQDPLKALVPLVSSKENQSLTVTVLRANTKLQLTLVPRVWAGRGLLGCHLLPYSP